MAIVFLYKLSVAVFIESCLASCHHMGIVVGVYIEAKEVYIPMLSLCGDICFKGCPFIAIIHLQAGRGSLITKSIGCIEFAVNVSYQSAIIGLGTAGTECAHQIDVFIVTIVGIGNRWK